MSNWPLVPLGDILAQDGQTERIANTESEKFLTIRLYGKGLVERSIGSGKTPKPFVGYRVKPGQFVYSRIDARNGAYGVVPDELDGAVCSKDFPKFDVDQQRADENYLLRLVQTRDFYRKVQDLSFGATNRQRVKEEEFLRLRIPLPPIEEQRRIAAILDHADALRAKRREALARLDELTQSIFIDMFGDPVANERNWPFGTVGDFVDRFEGGKNIVGSGDSTDGYRVLKVSAVTSLSYRESESKPLPEGYVPPSNHIVQRGDLLFSRANTSELVGATALVTETDGRTALPDKLWRFKWKNRTAAVPGYVAALFQRPSFRQTISDRATGSSGSMKNISQSKVLSIPLGIPPVELQEKFESVRVEVDSMKNSNRIALAELDALFASLQSRAFRGEL
ncbi:restriction endonuclease subunit S [Nocardia farcinica]|uniref:Putative restriction-modification system specificity determinant n=1 Tax=Nocardia farcinica (strain IFM 10152) TaxID=247156 RepID=Q5YW32_NOCFA|nr:restriction endonuclease subunit S [Nocardia farcinica]BAD57609.1 putative restriction-modification system specificity determinant [Nocardia farcinica IFM 10152]